MPNIQKIQTTTRPPAPRTPIESQGNQESQDGAQRRRASVALEAALGVLGGDSNRQDTSRRDSNRQDEPEEDPDGAAAMFSDPAGPGALIMDLGDGQDAQPAAPAALIMDLGDDQEDARTFLDEIEATERAAQGRPDTPVVVGVEGRSPDGRGWCRRPQPGRRHAGGLYGRLQHGRPGGPHDRHGW